MTPTIRVIGDFCPKISLPGKPCLSGNPSIRTQERSVGRGFSKRSNKLPIPHSHLPPFSPPCTCSSHKTATYDSKARCPHNLPPASPVRETSPNSPTQNKTKQLQPSHIQPSAKNINKRTDRYFRLPQIQPANTPLTRPHTCNPWMQTHDNIIHLFRLYIHSLCSFIFIHLYHLISTIFTLYLTNACRR